jgi:hypothetical protein
VEKGGDRAMRLHIQRLGVRQARQMAEIKPRAIQRQDQIGEETIRVAVGLVQ